MKTLRQLFPLAFPLALLGCAAALAQAADTPYAGQQTRAIKALSAEETRALLTGAGMGYARAAELNRHPGPMHALELAARLELTMEQKETLAALMARHKAEARTLGAEVVRLEGELDAMFAGGKPVRAMVEGMAAEIGLAQARYRASHLTTHIDTARLLTPEQIASYDRLRGYTGDALGAGHRADHRGSHAH